MRLLPLAFLSSASRTLRRAPVRRWFAMAPSGDAARPPLAGVVFDMDGTLTVPNLDFAEMYRRAGVPAGEDILSAKWRADADAQAVVDSMEAEGRATLELMPGAAELGAWLRAHAIPTALVTRNSALTVAEFHARVWPHPALQPAISRDTAVPPKPDPGALLHICESWGVAAGPSVVMVGDSPSNDIVFGKAAGVRTALLDTGRRLTEGGQTRDPDNVVENLSGLAALLWRDHAIDSPMCSDALHRTKLDAPVPSGAASEAAARGDMEALTALDAEALSAPAADGQTALIWAADAGHLDAVTHLLGVPGVDADAKGFLGATAASRAARRGHAAVLAALLAHGADANVPNDKLQYPLHFAAFKLNPECVDVLLAHPAASPLVLDRKGRTAAEDTSDEAIAVAIRAAQREFVARKLAGSTPDVA